MAEQKMQAVGNPAECTPDALQAHGFDKDQAEAVSQAVGAGVPWLTIVAALAQRLGPVALDVLQQLLSSFSRGTMGTPPGSHSAPPKA